MENKVVLFFPFLEEGKDFHWPPISLLALAAVLKQNNFKCVIIDERVEKNAHDILKNELKDALCLGLTAFTGFSLSRSVLAAKICREFYPQVPIIWGGPHVTALPEQSKKSSLVDDVVEGYGEFEFLEKVKRIAEGKDYKLPVDTSEFRSKLMATDMPTIPYDLLDFKKYINKNTEASIYLSSYGCPGQCTFCSTQVLRRWTPFALEKVKRDLDNLFAQYPFRQLVFFDATFFANFKRAMEIIKYIKKFNVSWIADARTYEIAYLTKEDISWLETTNLKSLSIGLETGSSHMVEIFNKGSGHVERMYKIANDFKNSSIKIVTGIIFGSPGETIDDLKETLKVIKDLKTINSNFQVGTTFFRPLPGTALYDTLEQKYQYKFPKSLEEWAEYSAGSHYKYNQFMDIPWFDKKKTEEYQKIYNEFWEENAFILSTGADLLKLKDK